MRLRVVTYNIHKCIGGLDRRYDPLRVAHVIARYEPDLVLLQEVDQHARRSNAARSSSPIFAPAEISIFWEREPALLLS